MQDGEHGRSQFSNIVDDPASFAGKQGLDGYGVYADAVNFYPRILDGPDGGLGELQVIRFAVAYQHNDFSGFRHGVKLMQYPPQGRIHWRTASGFHREPGMQLLTVQQDGSNGLPVSLLFRRIRNRIAGEGGNAHTDAWYGLQS